MPFEVYIGSGARKGRRGRAVGSIRFCRVDKGRTRLGFALQTSQTLVVAPHDFREMPDGIPCPGPERSATISKLRIRNPHPIHLLFTDQLSRVGECLPGLQSVPGSCPGVVLCTA
jgi:hypothetical protein